MTGLALHHMGGRTEPYRAELSLFPAIVEHRDSFDEVRETLLANRFRWYCNFSGLSPGDLWNSWSSRDPMSLERAENPEIPWEAFKKVSRRLGMWLLREELQSYPFFLDLSDAVYSRSRRGESCLVVGPTAGGELEVVSKCSCFPTFLAEPSPSVLMAESRVMEDGFAFESKTRAELLRAPQRYRLIVLTDHFDEPETIRFLYDLLGLYGYVFCPSRCTKAAEEMEMIGMVKRDRWLQHATVYFKYPGLPVLSDK